MRHVIILISILSVTSFAQIGDNFKKNNFGTKSYLSGSWIPGNENENSLRVEDFVFSGRLHLERYFIDNFYTQTGYTRIYRKQTLTKDGEELSTTESLSQIYSIGLGYVFTLSPEASSGLALSSSQHFNLVQTTYYGQRYSTQSQNQIGLEVEPRYYINNRVFAQFSNSINYNFDSEYNRLQFQTFLGFGVSIRSEDLGFLKF